MPQLCVYLDDETMELLKTQAAKRGLSLSKCAAESIRNSDQPNGGWPAYFTSLYGSVSDPAFERMDQGAAGSAGAAESVRGNHVRA